MASIPLIALIIALLVAVHGRQGRNGRRIANHLKNSRLWLEIGLRFCVVKLCSLVGSRLLLFVSRTHRLLEGSSCARLWHRIEVGPTGSILMPILVMVLAVIALIIEIGVIHIIIRGR